MPPPEDVPGSPPEADLRSLGRSYFDELYQRSADGDPWQFAQSRYEAMKYAATLACLPRPQYRTGLEVGCSIGVFTRLLGDRVGDLLAIDIAAAPLDQARSRCADRPHCRFAQVDVVQGVPAGPFDLITLAEVAYYWTAPVFRAVWPALVAQLADGGQILLVHWRAPVPDYPLTGDVVHQLAAEWARTLGWIHRAERIEEKYRLDVWEQPARPATEPDGS